MTTQQIAIIRSFKGLADPESLGIKICEVPIFNEAGTVLGRLKPIDEKLSHDSDIIASLMRWRQRFMCFFLTQFQATPDRTARWLQQVVIPDDSRILFLIYDETGKAIGNFGICNISPVNAELDNLIRGEKGGAAQLIFYAEIALMHWIYRTLGVANIYLHVFSSNRPTVALHTSIGFEFLESLELRKIQKGDETQLVLAQNSPLGAEPLNFSLLKMGILREEFYVRHPWVMQRDPE